MTGWSPNTKNVIDKGFGGSRGGNGINGAVPHHAAGTDAKMYVANANDRDSHPTYHIDRYGNQTGIVHPTRRPFSTAHGIDAEAITFEMDNASVGGDWPIANPTLEQLINTLLWHESQSSRKGFELNQPGVTQKGFFIAWHQQYSQTACPGPFMLRNMRWLVDTLNQRKGSGVVIKPPVHEVPVPNPGNASELWTDAVNDGVPGPVYWTMVQTFGRMAGMYPNGYVIDGKPGDQTRRAETALTAQILNAANLGKKTNADKDGEPYNGSPENFSNYVWLGQQLGRNKGFYPAGYAIDGIDGPMSYNARVRILAQNLNAR